MSGRRVIIWVFYILFCLGTVYRVHAIPVFQEELSAGLGLPQYIYHEDLSLPSPLGQLGETDSLAAGRLLTVDGWAGASQHQLMHSDWPCYFRVPALHGYGPTLPAWLAGFGMYINGDFLPPVRKYDLFGRARWLLDAMAVDYLVASGDTIGRWDVPRNQWIRSRVQGDCFLLEREKSSEFGFFAEEVRIASGFSEISDFLGGSPGALEKVVFVYPGAEYLKGATPGMGVIKGIHWSKKQPNAVTVDFYSKGPVFLVLKIPHDPAWKGFISEKEVNIVKVDGFLMGIPVEDTTESEKKLRLNFNPWGG